MMSPMEPKQPALEAQSPAPASVPWGAGDIARALLVVLLLFPVLIIIGRTLISSAGMSVNGATLIISLLLEGMLIVVAVRFSVAKYHGPWGDLGLRSFAGGRSIGYTALAIIASIAIVGAYSGTLRYFGLQDRLPPVPLFKEHNTLLLIGGVVVASLLAPLAEELFFRGFLFAGMRNGLGPWFAAIFSSVLFALAHMSPYLYPPVFAIGLFLTWVYRRTGSLWYNILAHMGYNSLVALVALSQR